MTTFLIIAPHPAQPFFTPLHFVNFGKNGHFNDVDIHFLYLTPTHHADLLNSIVQVDLTNLRTQIENAAAISLRIDGYVDRTQEHNIYVYVMAHLVAADLLVLGFSVPKNGGNATSYFQTAKDSVTSILPWHTSFQGTRYWM